MFDPIEPVIREIRKCPSLMTARQEHWLEPQFLNDVAEVFENCGFETTRAYVLSKEGQQHQAQALLEVLKCLKDCPAIVQRRAIGSAIIKAVALA